MNTLQNNINCNNKNLTSGVFQGTTFKSSDGSLGITTTLTIYSFTGGSQYDGSYSGQSRSIKNGLIV